MVALNLARSRGRGMAAHGAPASAPVAFLVRTHDPTDAMLARIMDWFRQLRCTEFELHVSVDASRPRGQRAAARLRSMLPAGRVHSYTEAELVARYARSLRIFTQPAHFAGGAYASGCYFRKRAEGMTISWGFHTEAIGAWAHGVRARAFSRVWVCEDDVGFSGSLPAFLRAYEPDGADLICNEAKLTRAFRQQRVRNGAVVRAEEGWLWHGTVTPAYARLVPTHMRYTTQEHLVRLSARFLRELEHLARVEGVSAWSEQSMVSLALVRRRPVAFFERAHVGTPFAWWGRVSRRDWVRIGARDAAALRAEHDAGAPAEESPRAEERRPHMAKRRRLAAPEPPDAAAARRTPRGAAGGEHEVASARGGSRDRSPMPSPAAQLQQRAADACAIGKVYHALKY